MNDFRMRNQEREINKTHVAFFQTKKQKNFEQCTMYLYDQSDILYWIELLIELF